MLEHFLAIKKHRKENTIEVALYPIISDLVSKEGMELPASSIWHRITTGEVDGYFEDRKPNEYQTADFGTIYRNSITNIICDKFGAQRRHKERGNILIFDLEKLVKIGKSYDIETSIQLKLPTEDKAEGSEGSEGFRKEDTRIDENPDVEIANNHDDFNKVFEQIPDNASNNIIAKDEKLSDNTIKSSEPSEPSGSESVSDFHKNLNTSNTIYRLGHSDIFGCKNCKVKGDKFLMEVHACKPSKIKKDLSNLHILNLIKCKYEVLRDKDNNSYYAIPAYPAKGILYVTEKSPDYISGEVRMRGRNGGSYPYKLPELINNLFGEEKNAIEVCSGSIKGRNASSSPYAPYTVDINPAKNPDYVGDAQVLKDIVNGIYARWMGDPPYNPKNAKKMYGTELPDPLRLLEAGARVCKPGSLMFLLLGNSYQPHPKGVMRIGCIAISVIPNNEVRFLNIYLKYEDA